MVGLYVYGGGDVGNTYSVFESNRWCKINAALTTSLFLFVAWVTVTLLFIMGKQKMDLSNLLADNKTLVYLIIAGVTIGLTDFWVVTSYAKGAPISIAGPIFSTVGLVLIAIIGLVVFKEDISWYKALGFMFSLLGIFLLAR